MNKLSSDIKTKPSINNKFINHKYRKILYVESFSVEKLNECSEELVEFFKLIQAVRYDRINLQENYNEYRLKLSNDRMDLEAEVIKIKKRYNTRIAVLQEEYNSLKSNSAIELAKVREN